MSLKIARTTCCFITNDVLFRENERIPYKSSETCDFQTRWESHNSQQLFLSSKSRVKWKGFYCEILLFWSARWEANSYELEWKNDSSNKSMSMLPFTILLDSRYFIPNRSTVIVQFVIEKIASCHLSFSCWHLVFWFMFDVSPRPSSKRKTKS